MIEKNNEIFKNFQLLLSKKYEELVSKIDNKEPLKNYIVKSGTLLKNNEWIFSKVIDLSSMPQDEIVINTSSNGCDFSTNIKTLTEDNLLYGSIRPYFKKCGFCVDEKFVAGTVHTFTAKNDLYLLWILATICSNNFHKYTESNSQGTKMPIINWETFCRYNMPIPSQIELDEFNKLIKPIYILIKTKMRENKKLQNIKDILLKKYFG